MNVNSSYHFHLIRIIADLNTDVDVNIQLLVVVLFSLHRGKTQSIVMFLNINGLPNPLFVSPGPTPAVTTQSWQAEYCGGVLPPSCRAQERRGSQF